MMRICNYFYSMHFLIVICLQLWFSSVSSDRNNTVVTIEIQCFKHENPDRFRDICGGEDCGFKLKLCVQSADAFGEGLTCEIYKTIYQIKNHRGMCLRGIHDTRSVLKQPQTFQTMWKPFTIFIQVIKVLNNESSPLEVHKYRSGGTLGNQHGIDMKSSSSEDNLILKITIDVTIACSPNFYGKNCEVYCINGTSNFFCNETGFRNCINDYYGPHCNLIGGCPEAINCDCKNNSVGQTECSQPSMPCNDQIPGCNNTCTLDLITLNFVCLQPPSSGNVGGKYTETFMFVTMPVSVLAGIIVLLLLIIFIQAIYKKRRQTEALKEQRVRRSLPQRPRDISYIDDFSPPYSPYLDMKSQNQSQSTYNDSTVTDYQYDSLSTNARRV